jgi:DNA-binding transcriptional LysR family regulator
MRLNQFLFLVELKKHGSYSKAAEMLRVSQPSISRAIKELEEELGYELLYRGKNGVRFTERGAVVLENAAAIMERIENIRRIQYEVGRLLKTCVYLGGTPYFCDALLSDVLISIQEKYPHISIELKEDSSRNTVKNVVDHSLDMGVVMTYDSDENRIFHEIERNELHYLELFSDDVCFCVRPNHPLCGGKPVPITEVMHYPYVTSADSTVTKYTLKFFKKYGYDHEIREISNRNSLRKFVLMCDAITAMPQKLFYATETVKQSLTILPTADFRWRCKVGLIHREKEYSPAEKKIVEELTAQCWRFM